MTVGLLILSASLLALSFIPWLLGLPALFFLIPALTIAERELSWQRRTLWGLLWGVLIFTANFYWTIQTMHVYGRMSLWLCIVLFIPLAVYQMAPFIIWFALYRPMSRRHPFLPVLALPLLIRLFPLVFPYTLASAISVNPFLVQSATLWGEWGLDALMVLSGILLLDFWKERSRRNLLRIAVLAAVFVVAGVVGMVPRAEQPAETVKCVVLQPCVRDLDREDVKRDRFFATVRAARGRCADALVILPESAVPDSVSGREDFFDVMSEIRSVLDARAILFNAVVYRKNRLTNSEFLLTKNGGLKQYDKHRLILFGERFPLYNLFRKLPIYAANFANFSPGPGPRTMSGADMTIATPICLEGIYEEYVAALSRSGDILVNPTDDEWFHGLHATWLHFSQVRIKTVANRRWLVRAANTGYSVAVDDRGRIVKDIPVDTPGVLEVNVPQRNVTTPFQWLAPFMRYLFLVAMLALWFVGKRRS